MGKKHKKFLGISGYVVPASRKRPANLDEAIADAIAEHRKVHSNDGASLFIFGTLSPSVSQGYLYPISSVDADYAFHIAQVLHESRGLPASHEWSLLFTYGDAGQQDTLIQ
jgi:hypothetical protein